MYIRNQAIRKACDALRRYIKAEDRHRRGRFGVQYSRVEFDRALAELLETLQSDEFKTEYSQVKIEGVNELELPVRQLVSSLVDANQRTWEADLELALADNYGMSKSDAVRIIAMAKGRPVRPDGIVDAGSDPILTESPLLVEVLEKHHEKRISEIESLRKLDKNQKKRLNRRSKFAQAVLATGFSISNIPFPFLHNFSFVLASWWINYLIEILGGIVADDD